MNQLQLRDIVSALQAFRVSFGYLDVFVKDVTELARGDSVFRALGSDRFRTDAGGTALEMELFRDKSVARFKLADPTSVVAGVVLGSAAGALMGIAVESRPQAPSGLILGLLLGGLLGAAAGAAVSDARVPRRVLTLRYDPNDGKWKAYHGPYLDWAKEALRAE